MITRRLLSCPLRAVAVLLAVMAGPGATRAQLAVAPTCTLEAGPVRAVTRVLDGETFALDDGSEVRLVGALAPRGSDVGAADTDWPPAEDARRALEELALGRSVALGLSGRSTDRYGRRLAHVVVEGDGGRQWVQAAMLERGMARAYVLPGSDACMADLIAHERRAREAHRGLWANAAYRVRSARKPAELLAYRNTFQLVAGVVAAVATVRGRVYLRFGATRRPGFSVVVKNAARLLPAGMHADALAGRSVLVRGWIGRRWGPTIEVDSIGQMALTGAHGRSPVTGTIAK